MIQFEIKHLDDFEFTEYTEELILGDESYLPKMALTLDGIESYSIVEDGKIVAVIGWHEYYKDHFHCMLLPSKSLSGGKMSVVRKSKKIIDGYLERGAKRIDTESYDCDLLERWHKFMGFTKEGVRKNFIGDRDYVAWGIVNGN